MNIRVRLSEGAITDLLEIREWVASQSDAEIAESYVERIRAKIDRLTDFPERGEAVPDVRRGTRKLSFERRYIIFYRVLDGEVLIDRVLSGHREIDGLI